jgi:threonine synthase
VFVEPASAASVAGLLKLARSGYFKRAKPASGRTLTIVCILTGHGLKDPERAIKSIRLGKTLPPSLSAITKAVGLK